MTFSETQLPAHPLLLYDGTCSFCARSVQFVLQAERRRSDMLFATLSGPLAERVRSEFPAIVGADSIILHLPASPSQAARTFIRSDAALELARYLGGKWKLLAAIGGLVPRPARDAVYRAIARHRHKLGGQTCLVPTAEQRLRFLDMPE